ncbi:toxin-antitoxin system, toxin component [Streptomyces sp. NRRL WC-3618]|uniref:DUF397 domain-containing protein n=1 Tax=Streptomyces sp. NRRL WC-3618 TaxID=1519490 RepID=UPI0006AFF815|nr:DUF397 domain-containing protein [Streptomyces sp. NRRL WC-3618]KOV71294.1 toxin-antitoxin system, toxin component [Streptomyces sp. NRRL WC-3618]
MTQALIWRKSTFSGGAEGNACVEIADLRTRVAVRDSKEPGRGALTFPARAFSVFVEVLKADTPHPAI